jgi:hypothetical protein
MVGLEREQQAVDYRLYFIDAKGHIKDAVELEGVDDADAIQKAEIHSDGREMELWRRTRVVMKFSAQDLP